MDFRYAAEACAKAVERAVAWAEARERAREAWMGGGGGFAEERFEGAVMKGVVVSETLGREYWGMMSLSARADEGVEMVGAAETTALASSWAEDEEGWVRSMSWRMLSVGRVGNSLWRSKVFCCTVGSCAASHEFSTRSLSQRVSIVALRDAPDL